MLIILSLISLNWDELVQDNRTSAVKNFNEQDLILEKRRRGTHDPQNKTRE